jgi:hypothetical protein
MCMFCDPSLMVEVQDASKSETQVGLHVARHLYASFC